VAAGMLVFASVAIAEVHMREVEYKQGNTVLLGFNAWDDTVKGPRPGARRLKYNHFATLPVDTLLPHS
jgi:hypothetical protein